MHFVTKYLSGLKRTVSADNRAPLIIYHQGGEEGEWRILVGRRSYGFRKKGGVDPSSPIFEWNKSNSLMDHFRKVTANKLPMKGGGEGVLTRKSQSPMGRSCNVYRDNQNLPTGPLADGSWSARKNTWLIKREKCLDWIHKVVPKISFMF